MVNKANKDFSWICSEKNRVLKLMILAFSQGPAGFRELREAGRNHFHLSWYLIVPGIMTYDQNPPGETFSSGHGCSARFIHAVNVFLDSTRFGPLDGIWFRVQMCSHAVVCTFHMCHIGTFFTNTSGTLNDVVMR